ncbi:hypothetical protein AA0481_0638 [Acetobacter orientalis NRIC 0481]|uniref:Uncharacterized protein n=1 Tax=Acetobacter orientalis TaxID=146474 RepID=A0A0D6NL66_9PROT|nr:hypothetical protein Abor_020_002 [Acetobacter orientalis]GBR14551.1 hypothetical protein AA0481_0638 [Acetobacter orientalis NRIC 0481]GEL62395.1 hypothetical protein AOR02nite_22370 [Acetobacter orientalis]
MLLSALRAVLTYPAMGQRQMWVFDPASIFKILLMQALNTLPGVLAEYI